jgi:hypothetical protein
MAYTMYYLSQARDNVTPSAGSNVKLRPTGKTGSYSFDNYKITGISLSDTTKVGSVSGTIDLTGNTHYDEIQNSTRDNVNPANGCWSLISATLNSHTNATYLITYTANKACSVTWKDTFNPDVAFNW